MFTYVVNSLIESIDGQWGAQYDAENNLWTGMVGMLQRKEVQFNIGALTILRAREGVGAPLCILYQTCIMRMRVLL